MLELLTGDVAYVCIECDNYVYNNFKIISYIFLDLATWIHSAYFALDFMDKVLTST